MLGKNSILLGFIAGMVLPLTAWLIFHVLYPNLMLLDKPAIPYLVALGVNLFAIRFCFKRNADDTGRGIMMATFLSMLLIIVLKVRLT